jgi:hypothetical protein
MVNGMQEYLGRVSLFDDPAPWLALGLLLAINLGLTLVHGVEELKGRLWGYFGGIAGLRVPAWLGIPTFSIGLTLVLWALGLIGIGGGLSAVVGPRTDGWALGAIGALIGGRVADGIFSHLRFHRAGYRPNPGLKSTPFYFAEAVLLAVVFFPGLSKHPGWAIVGCALGVAFFWSVRPSLQLARKFLPWLREEPWKPGQPRPEWAR